MTARFQLESHYEPAGDQPQAIQKLCAGLEEERKNQVLLGVTGSGKTFTMAHIINKLQRPAIIMAHNKTLAAQLYHEMKQFFPHNAVEYFVSYYDYYQPEAYVARTDTFIEKDSNINEQIDRLRHSATRALLERHDTIVVASVSCIYGIGSAESYSMMIKQLKVGEEYEAQTLKKWLTELQYERHDMDFQRGSFRVRGDVLDIFPAHMEDRAWRLSFFGDELEEIREFDPLTGEFTQELEQVAIFPNSHYVIPRPTIDRAIGTIKEELRERLQWYEEHGKLLEAQRLEQRTKFDLEMIQETGSCKGIENYSRHLTGQKPGEPPPTLFQYLPKDALLFMDESHVSVPQIGGMYKGDRARKTTLAEYGFRLPSCMDNRPLKFEEWDAMRPQSIFVSATPAKWEIERARADAPLPLAGEGNEAYDSDTESFSEVGGGSFSSKPNTTRDGEALEKAKSNRKAPSKAEQLLWKHLRGKRLGSHKFRRQQPVGNYIVDFLCGDKKLIVEADGSQHSEDKRDYDAKRSAFLQQHGYRVLRYWNNEILQNVEGVLEDILAQLEKTVAELPEPPPTALTSANAEESSLPSPAGGRGNTPHSGIIEQIIRPTGLVDPPYEIKPVAVQVDDLLAEAKETIEKGYRVMVTTLTKRMAEQLTEYLTEAGHRVTYLHSDIDTLERVEIIRQLRLGDVDILVGVNLLREGLDIPECGLMAILDADKEGFLRSTTSLIQTIGRAARNADAKVILYADKMTDSMKAALEETDRRRAIQIAHNKKHGITPRTVVSRVADSLRDDSKANASWKHPDSTKAKDTMPAGDNLQVHIKALRQKMLAAAENLEFEEAARLRDEISTLEKAAA